MKWISKYIQGSPVNAVVLSCAATCLGLILVFSMLWIDANGAAKRLANGVKLEGTVSGKERIDRPDSSIGQGAKAHKTPAGKMSILRYEYVDGSGVSRFGDASVSQEIFALYKEGDKVSLISNPKRSDRHWVVKDLERRAAMHGVGDIIVRWGFIFIFFFTACAFTYRFIALSKRK